MNDTQELGNQVELHISDRDRATRDATNQLVAAALELRASIGRTPYVTTMLNTLADVHNLLGTLADSVDKAERWLDQNAGVVHPNASTDTTELLKDLRRDLKGLNAALACQHRTTRESISRAWSLISHRDGVVGREVW